jgi:hypothetical protein
MKIQPCLRYRTSSEFIRIANMFRNLWKAKVNLKKHLILSRSLHYNPLLSPSTPMRGAGIAQSV